MIRTEKLLLPSRNLSFLGAGLAVAGAVIGAGAASGGGGYTCGRAVKGC